MVSRDESGLGPGRWRWTSSEATKPVITTGKRKVAVVVPTGAVYPVATTGGVHHLAVATDTATTATASTIFSQAVPARGANSETLVSSEAVAPGRLCCGNHHIII